MKRTKKNYRCNSTFTFVTVEQSAKNYVSSIKDKNYFTVWIMAKKNYIYVSDEIILFTSYLSIMKKIVLRNAQFLFWSFITCYTLAILKLQKVKITLYLLKFEGDSRKYKRKDKRIIGL